MTTTMRDRMKQDLVIRNYAKKTVKAYVHAVAAFFEHVGKSPAKCTPEDGAPTSSTSPPRARRGAPSTSRSAPCASSSPRR